MSDTTPKYPQEVLDAPPKFDPEDHPYGSELPLPDGVS